jgi:hypothetical protein
LLQGRELSDFLASIPWNITSREKGLRGSNELATESDISHQSVVDLLDPCQDRAHFLRSDTRCIVCLCEEWEAGAAKATVVECISANDSQLLAPALFDSLRRDFDTSLIGSRIHASFQSIVDDANLLNAPLKICVDESAALPS